MTRTRNLPLGAMIVVAAIAGCSTQPPPPQYAPIAPISGPQPIDGTYRGLTQLIRGTAMNCGSLDEFSVVVTNHAINFKLPQPQAEWKPVVTFSAAIGPDGSFNSVSGTSFMRGTLVRGHMQGEISGDICDFSFNADRDGTF